MQILSELELGSGDEWLARDTGFVSREIGILHVGWLANAVDEGCCTNGGDVDSFKVRS